MFVSRRSRQTGVRDTDGKAVHEHLVAAAHDGLWNRFAKLGDRLRLLRLQASEIRAREGAPDVQLAPRTKPGEPTAECRGRQRWVVQGHDDPHAVVAIPRELRQIGRGMHPRQRLLDDAPRRPVDRACGRPGGGDSYEESDEKREASHWRRI